LLNPHGSFTSTDDERPPTAPVVKKGDWKVKFRITTKKIINGRAQEKIDPGFVVDCPDYNLRYCCVHGDRRVELPRFRLRRAIA
jgi:hypothetical protein